MDVLTFSNYYRKEEELDGEVDRGHVQVVLTGLPMHYHHESQDQDWHCSQHLKSDETC